MKTGPGLIKPPPEPHPPPIRKAQLKTQLPAVLLICPRRGWVVREGAENPGGDPPGLQRPQKPGLTRGHVRMVLLRIFSNSDVTSFPPGPISIDQDTWQMWSETLAETHQQRVVMTDASWALRRLYKDWSPEGVSVTPRPIKQRLTT